MEYFNYLMVILLLNYQHNIADGVTHLECSDHIKPLHITDVKENLRDSIFWTKYYIKSDMEKQVLPNGFLRLKDVVRTYLTFDECENVMISASYVYNHHPSISVHIYQYKYTIDDKLAIFESQPDVTTKLLVNRGGNKIDFYTEKREQKPVIRFALVGIGLNYTYLIYQTCDKSLTWVQVNDRELERDPKQFVENIKIDLINLGIDLERLDNVPAQRFPFEINYDKYMKPIKWAT